MLDPITEGIWLYVAGSAVKVALLLAAAMAAVFALRRQSAACRHLIWTVAILALLLLPFATRLAPAWQAQGTGVTTLPVLREAFALASGDLSPFTVQASGELGVSSRWLLVTWATGAFLGIMVLVAGAARVAWTWLRSAPLLDSRWIGTAVALSRDLGLRRPVRLLQSRTNSMPVTWGAMRPCILLPADATSWTDERVRVVLFHELAHVRRFDWLVQILSEAVRALYWFHPFVWLAHHQLRQESERACDDAVLQSGVQADVYASHLIDLARTSQNMLRVSAALAMARPTNLERRFVAMLNPSLNRAGVSWKAALLIVAAAIGLLVPIAGVQAQGISGRLSGSVFDASGAVIPNATIIVSNPQSRTKDMTTSNAAGAYEFNGLPAGEYEMDVLKPGFARYQFRGFKLPANENMLMNVNLQLGSISESVTITAEGPPPPVPAGGHAPTRIRVGGNVQQARLLHQVRPSYPLTAKAAGIQGSVILEAVISREGDLLSLRVMNSQVDPDLARAAVEAVSQWRYQPTLLNGEPVEILTRVDVNFTLSR